MPMSANAKREPQPAGYEVATLAGGCFWCLEAVFSELKGVISVQSGYTGGHLPDPTYEQVCRGESGHAEAVRIVFDPAGVSYRELLEVFFAIHDPTTLNRQGNDVGPQYRSAIFYHSPRQKAIAQETIARLDAAGLWQHPIVTEVAPAGAFYPAEDYHQRYFERNPFQPYCELVIAPKVRKLHQYFPQRVKRAG
jgi:peptide-methionine (S)-S-oxide reductase